METHKMKSIKEWAEDLEYICCDGTYSCPDMDSVKEIVKTIQKDGYIKGVKACIAALESILAARTTPFNMLLVAELRAACQRLLEEERDEKR